MKSIRKLLGKKKVAPAPLPKPTAEQVEKSKAEELEQFHTKIDKLLQTKDGGRRKTRRGKKARRSTRKSRR